MTFKSSRINSNSTSIHILEYQDFDPTLHLKSLTSQEIERYHSFKHPKRKKEFVATRLLRHDLFGFQHIHYDPVGAPFIEGIGYISISHSKNKVAIAVNKEYKIGLDLEPHRANILRLAHKFLNQNEIDIFDCSDPVTVTKIWSAKEAMYKLAGRKKILFSKELLLDKDNNEIWKGTIDNHDHLIKVNLDIFDIDDTIISINSSPIEQEFKHI